MARGSLTTQPSATKPPVSMLLVTNSNPSAPAGGRELLYRLNIALLEDIFGDALAVFRLSGAVRPSPLATVNGHVDGVDCSSMAAIASIVRDRAVTHLFLDGSNLGALARAIRRASPHVRITTFFHNVEARFFLGALRQKPSPKALAVLAANFAAERAAVHASDTLICLSDRDSAGIARLYGRAASAIAPMALADQLVGQARPDEPARKPYILFVGGGFYANLAGGRWFAEQVSPSLPLPTKLVGRGLEALAEPLREVAQVEVVGTVDSLTDWYRDAALVVAPIFDGSGMKTKVAEALMHGKHVIGTPEAFSGYAGEVIGANTVCTKAGEFRAAVERLLAQGPPRFDPAMRALYEGHYSYPAARARMAAILQA